MLSCFRCFSSQASYIDGNTNRRQNTPNTPNTRNTPNNRHTKSAESNEDNLVSLFGDTEQTKRLRDAIYGIDSKTINNNANNKLTIDKNLYKNNNKLTIDKNLYNNNSVIRFDIKKFEEIVIIVNKKLQKSTLGNGKLNEQGRYLRDTIKYTIEDFLKYNNYEHLINKSNNNNITAEFFETICEKLIKLQEELYNLVNSYTFENLSIKSNYINNEDKNFYEELDRLAHDMEARFNAIHFLGGVRNVETNIGNDQVKKIYEERRHNNIQQLDNKKNVISNKSKFSSIKSIVNIEKNTSNNKEVLGKIYRKYIDKRKELKIDIFDENNIECVMLATLEMLNIKFYQVNNEIEEILEDNDHPKIKKYRYLLSHMYGYGELVLKYLDNNNDFKNIVLNGNNFNKCKKVIAYIKKIENHIDNKVERYKDVHNIEIYRFTKYKEIKGGYMFFNID
jgi:hypothetical protein